MWSYRTSTTRSGRSGTNPRSLPAFHRLAAASVGVRVPPDGAAAVQGWSAESVTSGCSAANSSRRRCIENELVTDSADHPWTAAAQSAGTRTPTEAAASRWNAGKDLGFVPLRPERVVEVRYGHMQGPRFRHTTQFVRWRPDRDAASCTYQQLERPVRFDLVDVLG